MHRMIFIFHVPELIMLLRAAHSTFKIGRKQSFLITYFPKQITFLFILYSCTSGNEKKSYFSLCSFTRERCMYPYTCTIHIKCIYLFKENFSFCSSLHSTVMALFFNKFFYVVHCIVKVLNYSFFSPTNCNLYYFLS